MRRIREHWGETLSKESKSSEKGSSVINVLDLLIKWISIVDKELEDFMERIHSRFLEMEKDLLSD